MSSNFLVTTNDAIRRTFFFLRPLFGSHKTSFECFLTFSLVSIFSLTLRWKKKCRKMYELKNEAMMNNGRSYVVCFIILLIPLSLAVCPSKERREKKSKFPLPCFSNNDVRKERRREKKKTERY